MLYVKEEVTAGKKADSNRSFMRKSNMTGRVDDTEKFALVEEEVEEEENRPHHSSNPKNKFRELDIDVLQDNQ
jgi:hypothetical protein